MTNDVSTNSMHVVNEVVIKALNHRVRRKILQNLYEYGWGGYSELSEKLNIKAGSFYHHIRLLEESGLVRQLKDKIYEITPTGAQATELINSSFSPDEEENVFLFLERFNKISNKIDAFPVVSIILLSSIICLGILLLGLNEQLGVIGYFLAKFDQTSNAILFSILFTLLGFIPLYIYFIFVYRRLLSRISFAGHLLLPQAVYILIITVLSFFPVLNWFNSLPSVIGITFTIFLQLLGITYYIHVFKKKNVRLLGKAIVVLILHQYYNLLVIFLFT